MKNDVIEIPKCKNCNNNVGMSRGKYNVFCSKKCSMSNEETQEKRRRTNLERYGSDHAIQIESVKKLRNQTNKEKFGVINPNILNYDNKEFCEKYENIEYKSIELPQLVQWIKSNCFTKKQKLNNRIFYESWWVNRNYINELVNIIQYTLSIKTNNITQKIWHIVNNIPEVPTCQNCNNVTNFMQYNSGYREYCTKECSYICDDRNSRISKNRNMKDIVEKCNQTNLNRYGVTTLFQKENFQEKLRKIKLEKYGHLSGFSDKNYSKKELEVLDFCNSISNNSFQKNHDLIPGFELDGYSEKYKLAFEFCGLYWHNETKKQKHIHYLKWKKCKEQNIKLITIFEDEWDNKKEQVKSFLSASIGIFNERFYANKLKFVSLYKPYNFFEKNHLQGKPNRIQYSFGLIDKNNEILAAVSFAVHHRNNKELVLNRLAFKESTQIVGGFSKLLKNSLESLQQDIYTWSDNRWSTGKIYEQNGFVKIKELKLDYSYVTSNFKKRIPKQSMRKKDIDCPPEMSESEYTRKLGYYKIWDCGKIKWKFIKGDVVGN